VSLALDDVLHEVLARSGARTVRVVDGRTRAVVAMVGDATDDDVAAFAQLMGVAAMAAAGDGGLDDVVVGTRDAVHVLRRADAMGSVLHVRLDRPGNVVEARSALASPAVLDAVRSVLPRPSPRPRHAIDQGPVIPRRPASAPGGEPALAALSDDPLPLRTGELAVIALTADPPIPLPRRAVAQPVELPSVLDRSWSSDMRTMRRLIDGLRRLS
jgi:hypothetical protein